MGANTATNLTLLGENLSVLASIAESLKFIREFGGGTTNLNRENFYQAIDLIRREADLHLDAFLKAESPRPDDPAEADPLVVVAFGFDGAKVDTFWRFAEANADEPQIKKWLASAVPGSILNHSISGKGPPYYSIMVARSSWVAVND